MLVGRGMDRQALRKLFQDRIPRADLDRVLEEAADADSDRDLD